MLPTQSTCSTIAEARPKNPLALAALGRAFYLQYRVSRSLGLLDQARVACNQAIEMDSTIARSHHSGANRAMAGNTALATQEVQKALQLDRRSADAYGAQSEVLDDEDGARMRLIRS